MELCLDSGAVTAAQLLRVCAHQRKVDGSSLHMCIIFWKHCSYISQVERICSTANVDFRYEAHAVVDYLLFS